MGSSSASPTRIGARHALAGRLALGHAAVAAPGALNFDARQEYRHRDAGHVLPGAQAGVPLAGRPALVNEVPEATGERRNLDVIAVIGDGMALR